MHDISSAVCGETLTCSALPPDHAAFDWECGHSSVWKGTFLYKTAESC